MNTKQLFENAFQLAKKHNHEYVLTDHVFLTLCTDESVRESIKMLFKECNIDYNKFIKSLTAAIETSPDIPKARLNAEPKPSIAYERYLQVVKKMVMLQQIPNGSPSVSIYNMLTELMFASDNTFAEMLMLDQGVTADDVLMLLESKQHDEQFSDPEAIDYDDDDEDGLPGPVFGGQPGEKPLPKGGYIAKYCTDLTELANQGKIKKLIGRTQEVADIAQILARKEKNNAAIVGEAGVGKTQIVEGLALMIAKGKVCDTLKGKQVMSLNIGSMLAGAKFRGDFEKRVEGVLKDLNHKHILFIDEIHTIMGTGAGTDSNMDLANMLKPKLSRGEISVIGATTYDDYRKSFGKDPALERRFMKIDVKEPTAAETRKILNGVKSVYEKHHNVKFSKESLDAIITLSGKHIHSKFWPDKAIDLLDASGARNATTEKIDITVEHVAFEVARIANLPQDALIKSEAMRMKDLSKSLGAKVFGQDEAVKKLTDSVIVARAGLNGKDTIQGGYLFVGPSGVGKTEIAKALAGSLQTELIRFDMSEFSEAHTVSRLVGSPPGYVGNGESEGLLIESIRKHPDGILLLDEVEKAHPDVFNLFLQVLDEGHVTSLANGATVKMHNITVIMTTNLGTKQSKVQGMGYAETKQEDGIDKAVKAFFRPEFLNRLDGIVKFTDLSAETLSSVAKKFVKELNIETKRNSVKVKLGKAAIDWIVKQGTVPGMGARPMKRVIHEHIKIPLASEILFGQFVDGGTAEFVIKDDKLVLKEEA